MCTEMIAVHGMRTNACACVGIPYGISPSVFNSCRLRDYVRLRNPPWIILRKIIVFTFFSLSLRRLLFIFFFFNRQACNARVRVCSITERFVIYGYIANDTKTNTNGHSGVRISPVLSRNVTRENPKIAQERWEVKSFLGLSGYYYRIFILNYGQIAKPLTTLLKKDTPYKWSDVCQ